MKKIAVLGATGTIGPVIVDEAGKRGWAVRVVSRSRTRLNSLFKSSDFEKCEADLAEAGEALDAVAGCDIAFHCVGLPAEAFSRHLEISASVLEGCAATETLPFLISSFWSYGPAGERPVSEDREPSPRSDKEKIRRRQEEMFLAQEGVVAILPDFFGPRADVGFGNPALEAIDSGETANWIGDLDRKRELIYVPDAGYPLVELADSQKSPGARWNLGGSGAITPRRFLELGAEYSGREMKVRTAGPVLLALLSLFNRQIRGIRDLYPLYKSPPILDDSRLRNLIGDYRVTPYQEAVPRTIDWIRSCSKPD